MAFGQTAPWMQISTKFANILIRDFEIILFSNNWLPVTNRKIGVFLTILKKVIFVFTQICSASRAQITLIWSQNVSH